MIHLTYTGSCEIDGSVMLCRSMNASLDQKVIFFDHILGLRDTIQLVPSSMGGVAKGEGTPTAGNIQKRIYRHSPAIAKASLSGPIVISSFQSILQKAIDGSDIDVDMMFWKKGSPKVTVGSAKISRLAIDLKAGEIAQFSLDVVGAYYGFSESEFNISSVADCSKLLTWDACSVMVQPFGDMDISSFNLTINNPTIPIYTNNWSPSSDASGGMMPQKIRIGMQEITGSIGYYDAVPVEINNNIGTVQFILDGFSKSLNTVFVQPQDDGSGGPYIRTVQFNGVNDGPVWIS